MTAGLIICTGQGSHPAMMAEGQPRDSFDFAQRLAALYTQRQRRRASGSSPVISHIEWRCPACGRVMRRGGRLMDRLVNVIFDDGDKDGDRVDISYDPPRWV